MLKERKIFSEIKPFLDSKEAVVITGMRRTGKTSLLKFINENIASNNKLFLDLENPVNQKYFQETDFEKIRVVFEILGLSFDKKDSRPLVFLDEIQLVRNLPQVVKYFIDHYGVKFFLTGSASYYIKNLFSESLAGRKYIFELNILTFEEFLDFKESSINLKKIKEGAALGITESIYNTVSGLYNEYLRFGGFPEISLKQNMAEKIKSLEDIFTSYFQLEVLRLGDFRKNDTIRDLILLLIQRTGTRLDISKLSDELSVSRQTIIQYISFLESTYFIKLIKPYSTNIDSEIRKSPKIYFCDSGMLNVFSGLSKNLVGTSTKNVDEGLLFENNVMQNLINYGQLNFYQRKSGMEIDFILNKQTAYEVKLTPTASDLRKLEKISADLGLKEFFIISKNYSRLKNVRYGFMI